MEGELPCSNAKGNSVRRYALKQIFYCEENNKKDIVRNQASETVRTTSVSSIFIKFWQGNFDMSVMC